MDRCTYKFDKDYYEEKVNIFRKSSVTIFSGITILVGCNGSGKTTLLNIIKECQEKNENAVLLSYNDITSGRGTSIGQAIYTSNMRLAATLACSSEGERIYTNIGVFASKIRKEIETKPNTTEVWLLFDAMDSGTSVDNIIEFKQLFDMIIEDNKNKDVFIIASANEYELAKDMNCLDVMRMNYRKFKNYGDYRNFIIKTRELKDKRYEKKE